MQRVQAVQSNPVGPHSETESLPGWADEATPATKGGTVCPWVQGFKSTAGGKYRRQRDVGGGRFVCHSSINFIPATQIQALLKKSFYFWDLNGYLVVRGVMDEQWLAEANEAVDKFQDRIVVGSELAGGSVSQAGTGRPLLSGLLDLPAPYNAPFRRMIAHPTVAQRLNWMGGSGYRTGGATYSARFKAHRGTRYTTEMSR